MMYISEQNIEEMNALVKEFECGKCHSRNVFIEKSGNNTGLYCADCGRWITWLNKGQLRIVKRQMASLTFDIDKVLDQLEDYGKYKGILHCEDSICENYIPVSVAKKIVKGRGFGGVLGYLDK